MPFFRDGRQFDRCLDGLGPSNSGEIDDDILAFEREYHNSESDDDIPGHYRFKQLKDQSKKRRGQRRPWHLHQIYVGPRYAFRAIAMFTPGRAQAWWVWAFKKTRDNEPLEIERAETRAGQLWKKIQGDNDVQKRKH